MYKSLVIALLLPLVGWSQPVSSFQVLLEPQTLTNAPALQSFALGVHQGEWLMIGGRKDGLHRRQPFASFLAADNNTSIYVVNPANNQVWSAGLSAFPVALQEQLQSTNIESTQRGNTLYLIGGYGYSATQNDHYTYPYLTAVDVPGAIQAIKTGANPAPYFRYIEDARMQVTGGYLGELDDYFYLVGGQKFIGRYNPMGPDHGPGFIQEYTNQIRKFRIEDDGLTLAIADYSPTTDTFNLHRRDYNMTPQIFPDGRRGFTAFSGVFQPAIDLPWLNTVDIFPDGYAVNNNFYQYLNQYHTAHVPLYDAADNTMYTIFFGGISRYKIGPAGALVDDPDVPFVNTISMVKRNPSGTMEELKIGEMPALLGAAATFIPLPSTPLVFDHVIDLNAMQNNADTLTIGYVFGGIHSTQPNIFFINTGEQSSASAQLFKVKLVGNTSTAVRPLTVDGVNYFGIKVYPNPLKDKMHVSFRVPQQEEVTVQVMDSRGAWIATLVSETLTPGNYELEWDASNLPSGVYAVEISNAVGVSAVVRVVKEK